MSDISRIKDKLTKLLKLSDPRNNASDGEVQNAMAMAASLMAKHNLTRSDLDLDSANPTTKVEYNRFMVFSDGKKRIKWEIDLCHFVTTFIPSVGFYLDANGPYPARRFGMASLKKGKPYEAAAAMLYGPEDDCIAAVDLYNELLDAVQAMALIRWGSFKSGDGAEYAEGFIEGLREANRSQEANLKLNDSTTYGLIIKSQENAALIVSGGKDWLAKSHGVKLRRGAAVRGTGTNNGARGEGKRDGSNYSVNKPSGNLKIN